jgi:hypothetical protein
VTVHAADVGSSNADDGVLNRNASNVFGSLDRFLDAANRLVEFRDDALAQAARLADAVSTIAQAMLALLGDQDSSLGAADVDSGEEIGVAARHDGR